MKNRMFKLMLVALIITAGTVMAANTNTNGPYTDTQIADKVAHEVRMYSRYTMWDNVAVRVREGDVKLQGQVSKPFKKADLGRIAQSVPGVLRTRMRIANLTLCTGALIQPSTTTAADFVLIARVKQSDNCCAVP